DQPLSWLVANIEPGERVNLEVSRDGQRRTVPVTVGRRPSEEQLAAQVFNPVEPNPLDGPLTTQGGLIEQALGLQVIPMTPQIAAQLGFRGEVSGLVVTAVDP